MVELNDCTTGLAYPLQWVSEIAFYSYSPCATRDDAESIPQGVSRIATLMKPVADYSAYARTRKRNNDSCTCTVCVIFIPFFESSVPLGWP